MWRHARASVGAWAVDVAEIDIGHADRRSPSRPHSPPDAARTHPSVTVAGPATLSVPLTVSAARQNRVVHHADVISMKGDSYRLKDRYLGRVPAAARPTTNQPGEGVSFHPSPGVRLQPPLTLLTWLCRTCQLVAVRPSVGALWQSDEGLLMHLYPVRPRRSSR